MTNLCDVCGKPATQSMLRDPFGKSDEMRFVCSHHGFRIRDPADAAAIEQLHAAVKAAQELAATRLMEIERLQKDLRRANSALVRHGVQTDPAMNTHPSDEPRVCGWRPIDAAPKGGAWVLLWWPDITDCAIVGYQTPYGWHSAVGGGYESGDKYGHPTHWMPLPESPAEGASRDASPADLVGALQDAVHTDPGPVRAGKAHRDYRAVHEVWQGESGDYVWHQSCQCSRCRAEYERLLALQNAQRT